jgi:hypothetical protein
MAQEPQGALPIPLRLQADYQRLINELRALKTRMMSGDKSAAEAWQAKSRELFEYIIAYKEALNG